MKYFYDCEFIEDGKTIDLISIGMVSEDGRELYLVNKECDFSKANDWVKENVLTNILTLPNPDIYFITRAEIKAGLLDFCDREKYGKPEFWGYYSAYDHVTLCQLFGPMIDLPKGWPMYTRDIKQWCDALGNPSLPEQGKGEHHALADAKWNRQAWAFLNSLSKGSLTYPKHLYQRT